ncbi:hypothetical protein BCR43DRAFT_498086 [Syncephalastrum racemosum]|uniref:Uncharacterized protein n=1 Tax=Syncephalastrum racemosum TaxID=13706 RepID=A0A1X2H3B2_SYNRA|nr:hypothetical protein BCR43DRAFT_498086 [Syncephalastrum racemosum]
MCVCVCASAAVCNFLCLSYHPADHPHILALLFFLVPFSPPHAPFPFLCPLLFLLAPLRNYLAYKAMIMVGFPECSKNRSFCFAALKATCMAISSHFSSAHGLFITLNRLDIVRERHHDLSEF